MILHFELASNSLAQAREALSSPVAVVTSVQRLLPNSATEHMVYRLSNRGAAKLFL